MQLIDKGKLLSVLNDNWLTIAPMDNDGKEVKAERNAICRGLDFAMCIVQDFPEVERAEEKTPTVGGWIPFVKRQLTDDEKNTHPDWCYILDGSVPEDEEEILLYRPWKNSEGYIISMDQYMNNGTECYLAGAGDIENGMFWMPLPEPPKEGK